AVVVGLLLGQPEDLLDPGAQPRQGRPAVLLELLVGVGELLLHRVEALLGLSEPALRVVHPLLGLGTGLLGLGYGGVESLNDTVHLLPVIAAENDGELGVRVRVVKEGKGGGGLLLLGHWHILADEPLPSARPGVPCRPADWAMFVSYCPRKRLMPSM